MNLMKPNFSDSNPQNLIFSDKSDSHKPIVSNESNPKKPSLPIRLPTIAKFRLSDDCIIWGNLDCDSSDATTK